MRDRRRDYAGFGRLNAAIKSTRVATGEHEYGRYGFRYLLEAKGAGASIWQPDIQWCGRLTELRRIGAMATAYDIPVIPHGGGLNGAIHWTMANVNAPSAELFPPPPGGPTPRDWPGTLRSIQELEFERVIGGHGSVLESRERAGQMRAYLDELVEIVSRAKQDGVPVERLQQTVTPATIKALQAVTAII